MGDVGTTSNANSRRGAGRAYGALVATLIAAGVAAASGCSATKPTELVPGVLTQVEVPRDLNAIQVEVDANGEVVFCSAYDVDESGLVTLPATLGVVSGAAPTTVVKVTIRGYDQSGAQAGNYSMTCPDTSPVGASPAPRVLRTSIQTFVDQQTLFLPMPLSYSCYDQDCSAPDACSSGICVCKGAQCVDAQTNVATLADFEPTLIDGTGICFNPSTCFEDATEPTLVDPTSCLYAAPPGVGVNVRVFYQDVTVTGSDTPGVFQQQISESGENEILNEDPQEGFCVGSCAAPGADGGQEAGQGEEDGGAPSLTQLQMFQLAPGLCGLVHAAASPPALFPAAGASLAYHPIGGIQVATTCPPKQPLLPICANQRSYGGLLPDGASPDGGTTEIATSLIEETAEGGAVTCGTNTLTSTPSVVYLIMDDSSVMSGAFGSNGYATAMSLSLANPVFDTTYAAFRFFPEVSNDAGAFSQADCTNSATAFTTPTVPFGLATEVQGQIAGLLRTWSPPGDSPASPAPLDLQAALRPDVGAYAAVRTFLQNREPPNLAAVMAFVNRTPDTTNDCNPPLDGAANVQAALEAEIQDAYNDTPSVRTYFVVLANSSGSDGSAGALDFYLGIQADLPQMVTVIDATLPMTEAQQVLENFAQGAEQLGTCLYEPIGATIDQLEYTVPTNPQIAIPANASCTSAQATVDGWGLDNGRVRVCGTYCTDIQNAVTEGALSEPPATVAIEATVVCGGSGDGGGSFVLASDGSVATDATSGSPEDASVDGESETEESGSSGSGSTSVASVDGGGP